MPIELGSGFQVSGNELPVYTVFIAGFQTGMRRGARSSKLRSDFIKQNLIYEESQELKGCDHKNLKNQ
jgi:hypothetical protein